MFPLAFDAAVEGERSRNIATPFGVQKPEWCGIANCRKVVSLTTQKKLGLRRTRISPHFAQNGLIAPKIPPTLSPLDLSTYTKFGPDRLRFAGLILERLIFRPKKSIQSYNKRAIMTISKRL